MQCLQICIYLSNLKKYIVSVVLISLLTYIVITVNKKGDMIMITKTDLTKAEKAQRNDEIRNRLVRYWNENYEPRYSLIAKDINVSAINLRRFASNFQNFGMKSLDKIEKFLIKQGY